MRKKFSKLFLFTLSVIAAAFVLTACPFGNSSDSGGNGGNGGSQSNGKNTAYIGDTVTIKDVNFTVSKVENTNQVGSSLLGDTTENNFMLVYITIKNNSNSELKLTGSNFYLYRGASKYETHSSGIYVDNGFYVIETIGSSLSKSFVILYETPDKHTESVYELEVKASLLGGSERIKLTVKPN